MPTEQTFNEALHGNEVIEAIVDKVRRKLQMDCFFNQNSAYDYFRATVSVDVTLHDAGTDLPTLLTVDVEQGREPLDDAEVVIMSTAVDIEPQAPNVVREETGQPIPVLTTNPENGRKEIKRVRYARPAAKKAARSIALLLMAGAMMHAHAQKAKTYESKPMVRTSPQAAENTPGGGQAYGNPSALSTAEVIALQSTVQDHQKLQAQLDGNNQQMGALIMDIEQHHPGYHLNPRSMSLEPNPANPPAAASPAPPAAAPPQR